MKADAEKSSYSAFERFLYWFFIPIVFTVVCIAVLFSLFDFNLMDSVLKAGHKVPVLGSMLPAPKETAKPQPTAATDDQQKAQNQQLATLQQKAQTLQDEYQKADAASKQKDQQIKDLQAKVTALDDQLKTKTQTDQEYLAQIQQLANTYAKMNPSKAAPLMENLTLKERVLMLSQMKEADRVNVLEKMDPKIAAESSILMKDVVSVNDQEIAALQDRLKKFQDAIPNSSQKLTAADIGQTFANMVPKSAATILLGMETTDPAKVIEILQATDVQSRSKIMAAIADADKDAAAAISAKLAP